MNYKLIVTDMDGTLLGSDHKVTNENKEALIMAVEDGIDVVVATGRMFKSAKEHIGFIKSKMPIISCNGALITDLKTGNVLYRNSIDTDVCLKIVEILDKYNVFYRFCSEDALYCKKNKAQGENLKRLYSMMSDEMKIVIKNDFTDEIINNNILKFIVIDEEESSALENIKSELLKEFDLEITSSWSNNIEIMNAGVNKGSAVKKIAKLLNIDKKEIIAFGDNYNDLSMLEYAGMGVAMGNADKFIKERANYVTVINDDSGVAHAIYKLTELSNCKESAL